MYTTRNGRLERFIRYHAAKERWTRNRHFLPQELPLLNLAGKKKYWWLTIRRKKCLNFWKRNQNSPCYSVFSGNGWHTSGVVAGLDSCGVYEKLAEKELEPGDLLWWLLLFTRQFQRRPTKAIVQWEWSRPYGNLVAWFGGLIPVRGQRKELLFFGSEKVSKCRHGCCTVLCGAFCLKSVTLGPGHKTQPMPHLGVCVWEGQRATYMWKHHLSSSTTWTLWKNFSNARRVGELRVWTFYLHLHPISTPFWWTC